MAYDIITVRTALTAAVENTQPSLGGLVSLFPVKDTVNSELVELDYKFSKARVAQFVNPEAEPDGTEKVGFQRNAFKLPTVQDLRSITGKDLKDVTFGRDPYSPESIREVLTSKITEEVQDLRGMVDNALGKMSIQVAFEGKLTVIGKGVNYELDFGRPAELTVDVGAGDPNQYWDNAGANIEGQFLSAMKLLGKYGRTADICVGPINAMQYLINNDGVKEKLDNRRYTLGNIAIQSLLATQGVVYFGEYLGVSLIGYDGVYQDASGNFQNAVPVDQVIFAATNNGNLIQYGESAAFLGDLIAANGVAAARDANNFLTAVYPAPNFKDIKVFGAQCLAPMQADLGSIANFKVLP